MKLRSATVALIGANVLIVSQAHAASHEVVPFTLGPPQLSTSGEVARIRGLVCAAPSGPGRATPVVTARDQRGEAAVILIGAVRERAGGCAAYNVALVNPQDAIEICARAASQPSTQAVCRTAIRR